MFSKNTLIAFVLTIFTLSGCGGGGGGSDSSSSAPVAQSGTLTTAKNTPASNMLVATDPDGSALTYRIVAGSSKGTVVITDTTSGTYTYTPNSGVTGSDAFTFRANDGSLDSNDATVSIQILNTAPLAQDGSLSVNQDSAGNAGTLIATDADNDSLVYTLVSNAGKGTAVITDTATGAYTYTPNPGVNGIDTFTFKANDGTIDSNVATVTIQIINNAPVAQDGSLTVNQDMPGNGTLIATDTENDSLTYAIVSNGSKGTAGIIPATDTYTYTPKAGENGTDTFTFKANDGISDSNTATVTVTITAAPVASNGCRTIPQTQTLTDGQLLATDSDSNLLQYELLNADGSSGGQGPIITANGGTVTIIPATGAFTYSPADPGGRGPDTFDYRVSDPDGNADSATETVIVDVHIMPFGDSITSGLIDGGAVLPVAGDRVGYRKDLHDTLLSNGFKFDFVGSKPLGDNLFADAQTESYGGWTASQLAFGKLMNGTDGIRAWLTGNPADIVLVHAGTNGLSGDTTGNGITAILDEIDVWETTVGNPVTVMLALIIDQNQNLLGLTNPDVTTLNNNILGIVANRPADDIVVVDQHGALMYPTDLNDDLHPKATGYTKMANTWFNSLQPIMAKCPP